MMRAFARVNWGRWLADCPRPECHNAEHFGPDPVTGHVGGLTGAAFRCNVCTFECQAQWPVNVDDIMYVLSLRPVPQTRNWGPGERLADLMTENFQHGIVLEAPTAIDDRPGQAETLLEIRGEHIAGGLALPAGHRLAAVGAGA